MRRIGRSLLILSEVFGPWMPYAPGVVAMETWQQAIFMQSTFFFYTIVRLFEMRSAYRDTSAQLRAEIAALETALEAKEAQRPKLRLVRGGRS